MTQGSVEDDSSLKRSLRWKNRFTKSVQQQQPQQQREPTQPPPPPPHCLPAPGVNGSTSDVTWSSQTGCSDNNSIHSGTSSSDQQIPPCDDHIDESTLTKTRQSRNKDLHCYFKQVPPNDVLLHDFNCALQKDVLLQGRLFITQSFVGFKSNILGYVTTVELKIENIKHIDRVRTLRWMPRVLQVTMKNEDKYTFTSFLSSLSSARDEAYYCLLDLWQQQQQQNPQPSSVPFSSTSSLESTTSTTAAPPPPAPAKVVLPPSESTEIPDIESNRFNNADDDDDNSTAVQHTKDNPTTETTPHSPLSSPFKIFHRRRAQTVSASNDSPARARSMTSNSTPVARNTNGHITWMDDGQEDTQPIETKPTSSSPPPATLSPKSSILKTDKNKLSTLTHHDLDQGQQQSTHMHIKTLLTIGGILLFLSHAFLTYEFYHVTQLFTIQQQQHQHSPRQQHDTAWISGQLQQVKNQAQLWERESIRQRRQLQDLIPS